MKFDNWYQPGSGAIKDKPEIRISKNFISINSYCIDNYFNKLPKARIGYNKESNKLFIKPTDEKDSLGLSLVGDKDANYRYLNAKNFIYNEKLEPKKGKKSNKYPCQWDDENKCLVVDNVIKNV